MALVKFLVAARGNREEDFANTRDGEIVLYLPAARSKRKHVRTFTGVETRMATTCARVVEVEIEGGLEAIARRNAEAWDRVSPPLDETVTESLEAVRWLHESIADLPVGETIRISLGEMWSAR